MHHRRGQANPITVVILVAVTIALAMGVYSFFQSQAGIFQRERILVTVLAETASSIDVSIVGWVYDDSESPTIACYYLDVKNLADEPRKYVLTVLPLSQTFNELYVPTSDISLIPVDQDTPSDGVNIYFFRVEDASGDGLLDVVGSGGSIIETSIPSCSYWRTPDGLNDLSSSLPTKLLEPDDILMAGGPPSLAELSISHANVALAKPIPALELLLNPREARTLLIVITVDDWDQTGEILPIPTSLTLATLAPFEGDHYLATAFRLPPEVG
ncbi:hypothetical protein APE_0896.1 [Aeropyrum pernix K1]|uniref:Uncharacterized protein n=1 Tax=Aeropyrum pernix (strain ATCC 700893 / DSM 11879 / JCM 9820 / NBRC 100138 / K1) TaxID=272557 RepID=Q9YDL7_AERPE|nr:archaellin/type IV pilin N-terminal domain-containing protein [Aeropyrum pernix]BAA79880.2 hypothetical protein APE_0896.1 [Aeropyrum pernix K1]